MLEKLNTRGDEEPSTVLASLRHEEYAVQSVMFAITSKMYVPNVDK